MTKVSHSHARDIEDVELKTLFQSFRTSVAVCHRESAPALPFWGAMQGRLGMPDHPVKTWHLQGKDSILKFEVLTTMGTHIHAAIDIIHVRSWRG